MTHSTTMAIRAYSRDEAQTDAYEALLDYYGKTNLLNISEEMGLAFFAEATRRRNTSLRRENNVNFDVLSCSKSNYTTKIGVANSR